MRRLTKRRGRHERRGAHVRCKGNGGSPRRRLAALVVKEFAQISPRPVHFLHRLRDAAAAALPVRLCRQSRRQEDQDRFGHAGFQRACGRPRDQLRQQPVFRRDAGARGRAGARSHDAGKGARHRRHHRRFRRGGGERPCARHPDHHRRQPAQSGELHRQLCRRGADRLDAGRAWSTGRKRADACAADRCLGARLVQSGARKPLFPRARLNRGGHDHDRPHC